MAKRQTGEWPDEAANDPGISGMIEITGHPSVSYFFGLYFFFWNSLFFVENYNLRTCKNFVITIFYNNK